MSQDSIFFDTTVTNDCKEQHNFKTISIKIKPKPYIDSWKIHSQNYHDDINFLIDVFIENGHDHNHMLANEKGRCRNEINNKSNTKTSVKLLWIPVTGPKIRKEIDRTGLKVVFTPTANLKRILCNKK